YAVDLGAAMLTPDTPGERIEIVGRLIDGSGAPVADGLVEIWQADANGVYIQPSANAGFTGWSRQAANNDGTFRFDTIKPGAIAGPDGKPMAPHINLWIVARGINIGLQTRLYFADEAEANENDWVLNKILDRRRRLTLIAERDEGPIPRYALDIHLQGEKETVFLDRKSTRLNSS